MIDGHTKLYGLLAHPAAHSLSPLIHNTSFKVTGINGVYLAFDVMPNELQTSVDAIRTMAIGGVNLSMPLKTTVIPLLDEITSRAERLNAVNTVINRDGKLVGDTTDGQGFIDALKYQNVSVEDKTLTVLGAGGAGRSIIAAAVEAGAAKINVFKRQNQTFKSRKEQLESWSSVISVIPYEDDDAMQESVASSQIVSNSTNIGMSQDNHLPISQAVLARLTPHHVVTDAIYFPLGTPFVKAAKDRGCQTFNGIGMLVHQAAGSFFEWTGQKMPVNDVISAVNQEIVKREHD
ncbi:Shikimate dehydrogenase (NADP(+)) [Lentilactobacillus hilgardii]|uniref:shikimate dehydrogenase n=1 Tax=Lentilactobacillus hilgardii TaxID=1588 RepID=UPI00019C5312|nr:shikimate dehydrogenase [Lentilactobacillus hilgardii]EEI20797.1 shikimate dehydrogenase [Lentilactobacillus buchneri ATCC 11577]MCT3395037.1 shikimate dehydrogenase [Lentilactobacillus hilgardii]QIR08246.1 Shikimate dehydrogenase (NADP(+)) [Lentilactobacillus hilgardii]